MKSDKQLSRLIAKLEDTYGVEIWQNDGQSVLDCLILTILSQSTSDWNRDLAWQSLKKSFPDWENVLALSPGPLANVIRSAGLANQKAERIIEILKWIKSEYSELNIDFVCSLPVDEAISTFTKLKGVGIKTMSVVLAFACGKDVFPVDTHVHRLCQRFGLVPSTASADKTHDLMQAMLPPGKAFSFHINLLKHGRQICKAQNPGCDRCPVFDFCEYDLKWKRREKLRGRSEGV
jgi:endonuclease-3